MKALRVAWLRVLAALTRLVGARELSAIASSQVGEIRFAHGEFLHAAAAFRRALQLDHDPKAKALDLGNLAHSLYRMGNLDEAARTYQAGLELRIENRFFDGIDADLTRYYHVCHYLGHPKEAREAYGMLMTPPGAPQTATFESYPLQLDEMGEALPVARIV